MRSKIVTIEDISNIVGIDNYIKSLNFDSNKLIYNKFKILNKKIDIYFNYDQENVIITMNKNYSIIDTNCSCTNNEFCPHITLAITYLFENEDFVKNIVFELNNEYDENFNDKLFKQLIKPNKELLELDIVLKQLNNYTYELVVKIGIDKKYMIKKQLKEFFDVYNSKAGEVVFGQNFIYEYDKYYFNEIDEKILEFINLYIDSQNNDNNYYSYYHSSEIKIIKLTKNSLKQFMPLLYNKKFSIEINYYISEFNGIKEDFPFSMILQKQNENIRWSIDLKKMNPFIADFSYIIKDNIMYHIKEKELLKMIYDNNKSEIILKKQDLSKFSSLVLNKIEDKIKIEDELKNIFLKEEAIPKYYFYKDEKIIGKIKLCYEGIEIDIDDDNNEFNGKYLNRNKELEKMYKQELYDLRFNKELVLDEKYIYDFIDIGLKKICKKYETYVSKDLKDIKIKKGTNINSTFSIGMDNILSYDFKIEDVEKDELNLFINSLKEKKKFYKLKNGNYIDLEDEKLKEFYNMTETLDINFSSYINGNNTLSKYKSIILKDFDNEFINLNEELKELINEFKKYKNINMDISKNDLKVLRDYQVTGIKWMMMLSKIGFGGILADEMGLGKSLQTIKYIELKLKEKKSKFLIVVPTSLIYNWENEFKKFSKNIKCLIINDLKVKRIELINDIDKYNVIITTYGLLKQDIDLYDKYSFDTCIIDEAQNIKNHTTGITKCVKKIKATTKFALTGTPLENSVLEIWSIFDFVMPGFLSNITKFKQKYSIKNIEENSNVLNELNYQISPFILRRKKKDVLKELPDKIETNYVVDMEDEQKKIYKAILDKTKKDINEAIKVEGFSKSHILILSLLTKLRQICIDPKLIIDNENLKSCKTEALLNILKEVLENKHKVLVFSQFPSALKIVKKVLDNNSITSYYLDGSTKSKTRIELVDAFNQDSTNVFLISLKAGGTGLNLTSADIVIHLDPWWNPAVEEQATDRSHRIGQKNVVEVIKIIAKGTIEEKILDLQAKKKNLSNQIVEGNDRDKIILSKLDEQELKNILMN